MDANGSCVVVDNVPALEMTLQRKERVVALVYVSWCPFCRKAIPVFQEQADKGEQNFLLVRDDEEHVADLYGIDVFPALILFEKGLIAKRLDGKPGLGLNEKQMIDFIQSCVPA